MIAPDFGTFYHAAHGLQPFPWQERLAERVLRGEWPQIDVPTGCGKTSVIDVAVFALAKQAHMPPQERSPLRIFFIIDRRLVVDDVYSHAAALANAIAMSDEPALQWARERLRLFRAPRPLAITVMRGGMHRSNTWADYPNQPLVCVSTVDQAGSRLLFRGYGVSDSSKPIQAALLGNDSLLIVDEAHLSLPLIQTLESVRRYSQPPWREIVCSSAPRVVQMSATQRDGNENSHRLGEEDYSSEKLRGRLEAPKIAVLKEVANAAEAAAAEALRFKGEGVLGIVLNTVQAARAAFTLIRSKTPNCILLTGRIRPYDRDRLLKEYLLKMKVGAERSAGERFFVVATQTIEVGADLDFDYLISETAPIDSLRQRFGRLNRVGRLAEAGGIVLKPKRSKGSDSIYGESIERTWAWLVAHSQTMNIDFGVKAMGTLFSTSGDEGLLRESVEAPLLFPAHLDSWAQTNPRPAIDPDVAPFLHGSDAETADVQIVWRADLDDPDMEDPQHWTVLLDAAPPISTEALPVPFYAGRRWLQGLKTSFPDIEGLGEAADAEREQPAERPFLIWRGIENSTTRIRDLRPGDTVVVRSTEGGCDEFGWNPDSVQPVRDIGDLCVNERVRTSGGRFRIRIHKRVLALPAEDGSLVFLGNEVEQALAAVADGDPISDELRKAFQEASGAECWGRVRAYGRQKYRLLAESGWRKAPLSQIAKPVEEDEPEEGDEASMTSKITLREHTDAVVKMAGEFANRCGLNGESAAILEAARLHDIGKQDPRFQYLLSPAASDEPLAKGDFISTGEYRRRLQASGFPKGGRHEFASVRFAQQLDAWPTGCDEELALYLIGAHHGYGRPFPPVWEDAGYTIQGEVNGTRVESRETHRVGQLGSGWAERYAKLTRHYGWWGLAFLEAILRRADCVVSREETKGDE